MVKHKYFNSNRLGWRFDEKNRVWYYNGFGTYEVYLWILLYDDIVATKLNNNYFIVKIRQNNI